jgi:hypothetical protein
MSALRWALISVHGELAAQTMGDPIVPVAAQQNVIGANPMVTGKGDHAHTQAELLGKVLAQKCHGEIYVRPAARRHHQPAARLPASAGSWQALVSPGSGNDPCR